MKQAVLITGAHAGTGYGIAEKFAKEGFDVFITSRRPADAEQAAQKLAKAYGIFAKGYEYSFHSEKQAISLFRDIDETGRFVGTLVLNAANMGFDPKDPAAGQDFWTVPAEDFRDVFETNLVGNFLLVRQAALRMREQGRGSIVFLSSNTVYRSIPNRAAYSASKGGITALARALATDLGPFGIRCNAVLPGTIKTERWKQMGKKQIVNGRLTPIGDISDYEDVANAVWFLGTDLSKNVTGTELVVDGGMSSQLYPRVLTDLIRREQQEE